MNLQITAVIDPADRRQRLKIRRGGGRAQFVSFNFRNNLIWPSSQARMHAAMHRPGNRSIRHLSLAPEM
jgi:hypothetical protein